MKFTAKKIAVTVFTLSVLTGCASRRPLPVEAVTFPEVGSVSTRNVGEALISHGYARLVPKLIIAEAGKIGEVSVSSGSYYFSAENADRIKFQRGSNELYVYKDSKKVCVDKGKCSDIAYSIEKSQGVPEKNQFQQTLLYNGKIGNRIALGYREFSGDIARPAFSNEVSYDLSESATLGYKGARIEVIKATNTEITYKLVSGFIQ